MSLDVVFGPSNISSVEQEFQSSPTVERAAQLLALVLEPEAGAERGLGELAAAAGLPKSTASRLLATLEQHGLVEQEGARGGFRAGPVIERHAGRARERRLRELAEQPMAVLADVTGETVNLAVPGDGGVEHVAQVEGRYFLGTTQWIGRRVPYHATANGKVLLAYRAAEAPAGPLEALTSRTIADRRVLDAELAAVRGEGFATAAEELELGLSAMAAPVFEHGGRAIAALSVSGPTLRLSPRRVAELRPIVIKQARALSEALGHRPEGVHAA
ncbi:MAG TPA: IclR family transcriptional regulator [Solirubrobacteraceae bacterium]|nr:IclR family transcriptional regulator [Solirubrobacteraceae bacterium]